LREDLTLKIRRRELSIDALAKTQALQASVASNLKNITASSRNRSAAFELKSSLLLWMLLSRHTTKMPHPSNGQRSESLKNLDTSTLGTASGTHLLIDSSRLEK